MYTKKLWVVILALLLFPVVAGNECSDKWSCRRSMKIHSNFSEEKVIILSLPRSGSSFLGSIFLNDPHFIYLFESLRSYSEQFRKDKCNSEIQQNIWANVTIETFKCNLNPLKDYTTLTSKSGHMYSWPRIADLSKYNIDSCRYNTTSGPRNRMSVAVKEIEFWTPKLNWLYDNVGHDLRVLWLVRDVRGWISSWLQRGKKGTLLEEWGMKEEMRYTWGRYNCPDVLQNIQLQNSSIQRIHVILKNETESFHLRLAAWWTLEQAVSLHYMNQFKGKAMLVKYEDFTKEPFFILEQIYSFLGRPVVHKDVLLWALHSTSSGNEQERYSTDRDSKAMTEIWRTRLSKQEIADIEEIAGIMFPHFGYAFASWLCFYCFFKSSS